jgi:hypothetical protein
MIIVSGGQSGVDRAALDGAITAGLTYRGWVPRGGWAEDYPRPPGLLYDYPLLQEATSANPAYRTRLNVRDSDATLILWRGLERRLSGGTAATQRYCVMENRPHLVANPDDLGVVEAIGAWLAALCPDALNVAGPRESGSPGAYACARPVLDAVFALQVR